MRYSCAVLILAFAACTHTERDPFVTTLDALPAIGSRFSPNAIAMVIFSNSNYSVTSHGINFTVEVSGRTRRVIAIYTRDPRFKTPEGVGVGTSVASLQNHSGRWSATLMTCSYRLRSGWLASVDLPLPESLPNPPTPTPTPDPDGYTVDGAFIIEWPSCPPAQGVVDQLQLMSEEDPGA